MSQGCRPIGDPFTVTRAERSMVYEIAGTPALTKLQEVVEAAPPRDRALARTGAADGTGGRPTGPASPTAATS